MPPPVTLCGSLSRLPSPLGRSMHEAGYRALGLAFTYVPFEVRDLPGAVTGLRALGIRGVGVSQPFKQQVLALLDALDPVAARIGAVNTIVNDDGRLTGHNTDWIGAVRALEEVRSLHGARVLLLGAGGAARAIAFGLRERGARTTLANRNAARAEKLAFEVGAETAPFDAVRRSGDYEIVINATSLGQSDVGAESPVPEEAIGRGQLVMDIVYKPPETRLIAAAERRGAVAVRGARMLLHQAAAQFELYTGRSAPLSAMDEALGLAIASSRATTPPPARPAVSNPFFDASPLLYEAPPFDRIRDGDYAAAIDEGMRRQLAEVETIATETDAPTVDNTVAALERSGALLTRVCKVFFALTKANTNETLQWVEAEVAPKLAAHQDAIFMDSRLFLRVEALYDRRDQLDGEARAVVERYHLHFVRAGAELAETDKAELRALNKEESSLSAEFDRKLLAAAKAGALVTGNLDDLAGLGEGDLAAASLAAKGRDLDAQWVVGLQNTTQQPALVTLARRATRERLFRASIERAERADANDTRAIVQRLAELRARRARLLGYPTYAAYALDDQMAKTPEAAIKLLTDLVPSALAKARGEAEKMQELVFGQEGGFALAPWDWPYYAEQVRKASFALDDAQLKPYLELDRVLRDGVFFAASELYGLSFEERHDVPVYHPDVRVFEVFDADGRSLGLFYGDYFKRDAKSGGAWMGSFVDASGLMGTHPVVYNVCNFTKPAPGQPALLRFDDVTAMFHEFGHALHGLLSSVKYPTLAGTNVPRDFVEFPSQFNENWATFPTVFARFAKHHRTGAAMPAELVEKVERSRRFNQGFATTEYLAAALLDMAWHTLPSGAGKQDVDAFEKAALARFGVDFALVPPRYRTSYFAHVWSGGYGAGYYAYVWSEVLDHDAFQWFQDHGGLTRENGQRFRDMILSRGHTQETAALYRAFRGKDPSVEPLLEHRGLIAGCQSRVG